MSAYDSTLIELDEHGRDLACDLMPYEKLRVTLSQVDKAGECLSRKERELNEFSDALAVLFNWRAAHAFPLNSLYVISRRAKKVDSRALTAQRMKRLESIISKIGAPSNNATIADARHRGL
jgi:hypothetical protein